MNAQEKMIADVQCPGCLFGPDPKTCPQFKLKNLDLGGFACEGHRPGTILLGQGRIALGLPQLFASSPPGSEDHHLLVLINEEGGKKWLAESDAQMNIPLWKKQREGRTFVRIARPMSLRYTTLVIDGEVEVPAPAVDVEGS